MRILLINVPHPAIGSRIPDDHLPPLGLLCIGGPLLDDGHGVRLIDGEFGPMTIEQLVAEAARFAPDAVLFGHSGSSSGHPVICTVARAIRQRLPDCRIIYGGVHPTYFWRDILKTEPWVDVIVRGEGEETGRRLIRALETGASLEDVRGLAFRRDGEPFATPAAPVIGNLDDYRVGWELIDHARYSYWGGKRAVVIQFSRGCPHLCTYCGQRGFWTRWRHRDPVRLAEEIAWLHREKGVEVFNFADENPSAGRKAWKAFLEALIAEQVDVTLVGSTRADDIVRDAEFLHLYKHAGFERFLMGTEDVDEATLKLIRKGGATSTDREAIRLLRKHNILSMATWVAGFVDQTDRDMLHALRRLIAYTQKGRPGLPTRLMAGLHLLKHMEGLSDEAVCARWVENPYFQYFCGEQHFRHKLPLDRSSMTRWRDRIGPDKLELLLAETLSVALRTDAVTSQACERVTLDTTVQTKAIAHPTDSHLLLRGIEWLNRLAKQHGITLRQSFLRVGRRARREVSRLIHGRGHKQAMRWVRKLRTWLGRLDRDIGRKIAGNEELGAAFAVARERVARILAQKSGDADKLYALHAPEVECIAKGKARTRYEFGVKTSIAVTNARTAGGQFIVGMQALPGSPYDGHTLTGQIEQVERLTGVIVERAYVDRGYRGHGHSGKAKVYIAHSRGITSPTIKRELRRRNAIEPIIGHTKSDGLLERNYLAGATGDAINAILVAAGHNLRLLVAWLIAFLRALIRALLPATLPAIAAA